jgi:hypothetical protein
MLLLSAEAAEYDDDDDVVMPGLQGDDGSRESMNFSGKFFGNVGIDI